MEDLTKTMAQDVPKKVLLETWGCQMNVADSEQMLGMLKKRSYVATDDAEQADLVLLNTCHIREKATHKILSRLGRLRELKQRRPGLKVAVAGCVAQAEGKKLLEKAPVIDILLGPGKISDLGRLLDESDSGRAYALGFPRKADDVATFYDFLKSGQANPTVSGKTEISRYVNIAQGCNNFCTFCVVPFTRGREISREPEDIEAEVRSLLDQGAKEITLLGQNVNSYGLDLGRECTSEGPFVALLRRISALPSLMRLRFTTSNPHDFTKPLADLFACEPKLGRYIHLPVQSGDDEVLERMKRKVTRDQYFERVSWLRSVDPEMALSTDLIVGFPGETEEQFEATLDLVERVRYSFIYSFKYSPRKGTAAARFPDQVDEKVMTGRLQKLNDIQNAITLDWHEREVSKTRDVLFHYESKKEEGVFYGRTPQFRLVRCRSTHNLVGQCLPVQIERFNKTALEGQLVN